MPQETTEEAAEVKAMDNPILNLTYSDDGDMVRWGNTLKRRPDPILDYSDKRTTTDFTEGCNTMI